MATDEEFSTLKVEEEAIKPASQPHEAMFLVLTYLNLLEHLRLSEVCKALRDGVNNDILLWLDIVVEHPLNLRIDDDVLVKYTSKAQGRLRSLVLMNCARITDDGLQRVIDNNLHINKLCVPSCVQLTPEGVVRAVKKLTDHHSTNLKVLRLENIRNITKDHLQTLYSCMKINPDDQNPRMYLDESKNSIDIEVCPKCREVKVVYECPRESCKSKKERPLSVCKGCLGCIPRCEGCGGCVDEDETGETACFDVVCLECWLRLPKCNMCNKPYCNRHVERIEWSQPKSSGFVCDACSLAMERWLASPC